LKNKEDITENDIYLMLDKLTSENPTETLKSLIQYCGEATQLLMDSSVALTLAEIVCDDLEILMNLILTLRTDENEKTLFEMNYKVNDTIKNFKTSIKNLNLPTPEEFGSIGSGLVGK